MSAHALVTFALGFYLAGVFIVGSAVYALEVPGSNDSTFSNLGVAALFGIGWPVVVVMLARDA